MHLPTNVEGIPTWKWLYFRKRFHDAIRSGSKTKTLRAQKLAVGAAVATPVGLIRVLAVEKETVQRVGQVYWREEGCQSPEDFFAEFQSIHPDLEMDLGAQMWLHTFRLELPA